MCVMWVEVERAVWSVLEVLRCGRCGSAVLVALALSAALLLLLYVSARRAPENTPTTPRTAPAAPPPTPRHTDTAAQPRRRSRRRAADKKLQRNGVSVEAQEELKTDEPAEQKSDKAKKNKKKAKAVGKEPKSSTTVKHKEVEEGKTAGTWETKVSQREKRQRRKDKGVSDESGSPSGAEPVGDVTHTDKPATYAEETPSTPPPGGSVRKRSSNMSAEQDKEESPVPEHTPAVQTQVSLVWEDMLSLSGSDWRELSALMPAPMPTLQTDSWPSAMPPEACQRELSAWPQDMEGSWTIVDSSQIPVSLSGLSADVETQVVPDLSWTSQAVVDDEWGRVDSSAVDPASDWSAPSEEWGNYVGRPTEGTPPTEMPTAEVMQESESERDRDETAAPAGNSKAKKKKKKKKKCEDGGNAAQVEVEVGVAKLQHAAGNVLPQMVKEQEMVAPLVAQRPAEPQTKAQSSASAPRKKSEDSWESPKQVKKKKARRET